MGGKLARLLAGRDMQVLAKHASTVFVGQIAVMGSQGAANIIHRNLQGTPLQDIPLQTDPAPRLVLGKQLAEIAPSAADH